MRTQIHYLYSEIQGHNLPVLERLASIHGASVDVVRWTRDTLTPFTPADMPGVRFHERSGFDERQLIDFALKLSPQLVYVSGWMDRGYLPVVRSLKAQGSIIVTGMDSQWTGSMRQRIVAKWVHWHLKKDCFSYAWVPGPMQYEFAGRIGFRKTEILCNLLSGNFGLFHEAAGALKEEKRRQYPKQFLYVGRFARSKGIDLLIEAFRIYRTRLRGDWSLTCIGNGPMEGELARQEAIRVEPFLTQDALVQRSRQAGAFVLASRDEPWGVVVHEFASAGLPMILSQHVGARPQFLIDGLNGYTFFEDSAQDLAEKMAAMSSCTDDQLIRMGESSARLAASVTPEIAAASLMSALRPASPHG